jgi:hypothetical protein
MTFAVTHPAVINNELVLLVEEMNAKRLPSAQNSPCIPINFFELSTYRNFRIFRKFKTF